MQFLETAVFTRKIKDLPTGNEYRQLQIRLNESPDPTPHQVRQLAQIVKKELGNEAGTF